MNDEGKALTRQTTIAEGIAGEIKALDKAAHELRSRSDYTAAVEWLRDVVAEIDEKERALDNAIAACRNLKVETPEDYAKAGEWIAAAKQRELDFKAMRERFVAPAHRLHKQLTGVFKPLLDKSGEAIQVLNGKMNAYDAEQERLVREREAELRRQAEEEAAKERADAEERAKAVEQEDPDLAEEIRDEAASQPLLQPIVAPAKPPKTEGLTAAKVWKAEVTDRDVFIEALLNGTIPAEYAKIEPNLEVLRGIAKATNGKKDVPGITFRHETTRRRK